MEKHFVSIALVQKMINDQTRWLLHDRDGRMEFIVADRLGQESFRETIMREVAWQLNLDRARDFLVSNMSQLSIEFEELTGTGDRRHVALSFYTVHIKGKRANEAVASDPAAVWLTAAEICSGKSCDGRTIHPEVVSWINRYEVVRPWQK